MVYVMLKQHVKNFADWQGFFEGNAEFRRQGGVRNAQVFHETRRPDEVTVLLQFDSEDAATKFSNAPALRDVMDRAGATGEPEVTILDPVPMRS